MLKQQIQTKEAIKMKMNLLLWAIVEEVSIKTLTTIVIVIPLPKYKG